ncbi:MAG: polysaccharide deacetylase family protein [Alphaproteobacteria bacterium]|nr:polysaccharide deacetylase family protein [Alphaproteobacteria bacterium]
MKLRTLFWAALPLLLLGTPALAAAAPQIAFTWDDLPAHSDLPPGVTRVDIARDIIAAMKKAHLPPAYGFVNGIRLAEEPASAPVLKMWRAAGLPLGNHTWSHMNYQTHTLAEYETEVERNEPLLRELMGGADWHWFRYPYLAEGDTPESRQALRDYMAGRGYKVAAVTMSFGDYLFNGPYARCRAKGDKAAVAKLEADYLAAAKETIGYTREMSHELYGHDIPYVLLMHVGALDARVLPRLIALYRSKGFKFITLQQAESDPWYQAYTNLSLPGGATGLEAALAKRNETPPARTNYGPIVQDMCR